MTVAVLGSGAFGTALAVAEARTGSVILWTRSEDQLRDMVETRTNPSRLPDITLPDAVTPTGELADTATAEAVLLAVPMQSLRGFLERLPDVLAGKPLVACCKGVELGTGLGPVSVIRDVLSDARAGLLTGPSFAADIARGLPTALTLACENEELARRLQTRLSTDVLRLYRTTDTIGAEFGGAVKNVMAIACGAVTGAGLGNSARAALMTRGYAEMLRLATARGARAETLAGLSGFGDLTLTCTSDQSRNYRFGMALGRGEAFDASVTVEGAATARAVDSAARTEGLDLPITRAVVDLIDREHNIEDVMGNLLARSLKTE